MENKKVVIAFTQSQTYKTDWKVRFIFQNGYQTILVYDEISKGTRFGDTPNRVLMETYATNRASEIMNGLGFQAEIIFTQN